VLEFPNPGDAEVGDPNGLLATEVEPKEVVVELRDAPLGAPNGFRAGVELEGPPRLKGVSCCAWPAKDREI
jgi:hypothetical protein